MLRITRRDALTVLGSLITVGCGSSPIAETDGGDPMMDGGPPPPPPPDDGGADAGPQVTPEELLATVDSIIVVMMENRSFDHFLGTLKLDPTYALNMSVDGLTGNETNPDPNNNPVKAFLMSNFTPADPPHGWDPCHAQWNMGKNDGFVKEHAGASQDEVMGYHDRSQIPFYHWLADNFTVCDHWYASVMGPTWPNRFYLHSGTSKSKKSNTPFLTGAPDSIWMRLRDAGKTYKNYSAGLAAFYTGGYVGSLLTINPLKPISEFFTDAKNGTLPNFAIIDPDFQSNDDHPSHDIMKGQVFVASLYKALAESPQWDRLLFVIIYDEHGGFFDHVSPPTTVDDDPEFQQLGFRVPAIVAGGRVKRGALISKPFDHTTMIATAQKRYGLKSLTKHADAANDLSDCLEPKFFMQPAPPPMGMPTPMISLAQALEDRVGEWSQPELQEMIESGQIPPQYLDQRPHRERLADWLIPARDLGVVRFR